VRSAAVYVFAGLKNRLEQFIHTTSIVRARIKIGGNFLLIFEKTIKQGRVARSSVFAPGHTASSSNERDRLILPPG